MTRGALNSSLDRQSICEKGSSVLSGSQNNRTPLSVRTFLFFLATFGLGIAVWFGYLNLYQQSEEATSSVDKLALVFANELVRREGNPGYVGPAVCADCHQEIHKSFMETNHPHTCRILTPEKAPKGFDEGMNGFAYPHANIRFEMKRDGSDYYQEAITTNGNSASRVKSRIDLVLGAGGTADDVFVSWHDDGTMKELPMVWLYPNQCWSTSHFDIHSGGDYSRALTVRCFECHNTWAEHVVGSLNQYRKEGSILGVTCEACHGPAADHVSFHQNNRSTQKAEHIVHPRKLERERQIEVCTQCHSNAMKHRGPAFGYRPGKKLDDYYQTIETKNTEDDRVANQITYLRQSKCFQKSEMTCITCHSPHATGRGPWATSSAGCAQCHESRDCKEAIRIPSELRDQCADCHMPTYLKINVNFETASDNFVPPIRRFEHRIGIYDHARDETLLKYFQKQSDNDSQEKTQSLKSKLVDHFKKELESCRRSYRFLGAIAAAREVVRIEDTPAHRELLKELVSIQTNLELDAMQAQKLVQGNNTAEAIKLYEKILAIKPDDANAHGRLGVEYAKLNNLSEAIQHWSAVTVHNPNDVFGLGMLGWLAYLQKRPADAVAYYEKAELIEPREAKLFHQKGLALIQLGRPREAIEQFKKAIAIDPNRPDSIHALIETALQSKQPKLALPYAEYVVQVTESANMEALTMLAKVYSESGMVPEAIQALQIASKLATEQDPGSVNQLDQAIRELQSIPR